MEILLQNNLSQSVRGLHQIIITFDSSVGQEAKKDGYYWYKKSNAYACRNSASEGEICCKTCKQDAQNNNSQTDVHLQFSVFEKEYADE